MLEQKPARAREARFEAPAHAVAEPLQPSPGRFGRPLMRSPVGGNGTRRPVCSRWYQAAPSPRTARPPESSSKVVTILASSPG